MLLRNATILLALLLCLAQTTFSQNFYYTPEGQVYMDISTEKILVQFYPSINSASQDQILSTFSNINLSTKIDLPAPNISILETTNISTEENVNTLLQNIKDNPFVAYVGYFLNHTDGSQHGVTDKIIVRLLDASQIPNFNFIYNEFEGILSFVQNEFDPLTFHVQVDKNQNALEVANKMHESGFFQSAEPDFLKILNHFNTNDPNVDDQWSLNNTGQNTAQYGGIVGADMNVFDAWNISTGASNIKVAIIDEGVDLNHPDLVNNLLPGFDATGQGSGGAPSGDDAHGTACAGIVAASANNGIGGAGVAYDCKIIPIRIGYSSLNGNSWVTNSSWIANGINWAWQNGNADILSNSWGGGGASFAINNAIDAALSNGRGGLGSPVIFAAGNNNSSVSYPASYAPTVAVIAMSMCNQRKSPNSCDGEYWWGSNYGQGADVAAPGVKIFTTDISGGNGYSPGDYTTSFNGTSSACPNAAGVMALILSNNNTLTANDARHALESTTNKVGGYTYNNMAGQPNGTWSNELGYGRINAAAALGGTPPPSLTNDAGITAINSPSGTFCGNSVQPIVVLKNYGTSTLTSVSITYSLNGGASFVFNWTGTLATSAEANVSLPNITLTNGNQILQVATNNPNGQTDANPTNDSQTNSFNVAPNNLSLILTFDSNSSETSWDIKNDNGDVIFSGNNYGNFPNGGSVTEDICLDNGCYDLTIYDAGGNGICCNQGNGSYQLIDNLVGTNLASGGQFGSSEISDFCLPNNNLPPLTLTILNGNNVTCFDGNDGSATVQANGGSGNYSYTWSTGAMGPSISNLPAGNYTVTASDGITSVSTNIAIAQPDEILIDMITTNSNGGNNGSATASVSGGVPNYTYDWSTGETTASIANLSGGTYTLTVTDQVGCSATELALISDFSSANLWVDIISQSPILCYGDSNGAVEVQANGGSGNYTYTWSNGETTNMITDLPAGTYTVTASDGALQGLATIIMFDPPILEVDISSSNASGGHNGSATAIPIGGTPNYSFLWSTGETTPTINNLASGFYEVTIIDNHDCEISETIEILDDTPDYCQSMGNDASKEWIEFVEFLSIQNFSGNDDGYADFTHQIAEVERGSQNEITLAPGFLGAEYEEHWTVWIDFNQDFDFDDVGEKVLLPDPSTETINGMISIPDDALTGMTRMRISMKWKEYAEPCEIFDYGEVEDYSILILPNQGNTNCTIEKIHSDNFENNWGIWIDGGDDCRRSIDDQTYARSGVYCIRLQGGSSSSLMTTENLFLENYQYIDFRFSFVTKEMESTDDIFYFQISRDGGQNFETIKTWQYGNDFFNGQRINEAFQIDGNFSNQTQFRIRSECNDEEDWVYIDDAEFLGCKIQNSGITITNTQPSPTNSVTANATFNLVKTFPNPANDQINVAFMTTKDVDTHITLTNTMGNIIFSQSYFLQKDKHQIPIDVSNLTAGIYVLNIVGGGEKIFEKIVVETPDP